MAEWLLENPLIRVCLHFTQWLRFSFQRVPPNGTSFSLRWVDQPVGLGSERETLGPYELLDWNEDSSLGGGKGLTLRLLHRPTGLCLLRRCTLLPGIPGLRLEGEIADPGYGAITLSAIRPWRLSLEGKPYWSYLQVRRSSETLSFTPLPLSGGKSFTSGLQTEVLPGIVVSPSREFSGGIGLFVGWPGATEITLEEDTSHSHLDMQLEGSSFAHTLAPGERFTLPETYLVAIDTWEQLGDFFKEGVFLSSLGATDYPLGQTLFLSLEDLEQEKVPLKKKLSSNSPVQTIALQVSPAWLRGRREPLLPFFQEIHEQGSILALFVDLGLFGCIAHRNQRESLKRILLEWSPWVDKILYSIPILPNCSYSGHTHQPTDGRWANFQAHLSLLQSLAQEGQRDKVLLCVPRNQIWPSCFAPLIQGFIAGMPEIKED